MRINTISYFQFDNVFIWYDSSLGIYADTDENDVMHQDCNQNFTGEFQL